LEEYATLRERRQSLDQLGEGRVNFFLATISGTFVGLALLSQPSIVQETIHFISGAIIVGLLWIGFTIFARVVHRSVQLILLDSGMNRIRRYFVDRNPEVEKYLSFPIYDDKPSLQYSIIKEGQYSLRGLPPLVAIINSIIALVGTVLFSRVIIDVNNVLSLVCGVIVFGLVITAQYRYIVNQMRTEARSQREKVRFPAREERS
jgi:hypothetical protein